MRHLLTKYEVDTENGYEEAILLAAEHDNCDICRELVSKCKHKMCSFIQPALEIACEHQNLDTVKELLSHRKNDKLCLTGFDRCYDLAIGDQHETGRGSEVIQIFSDFGAPVPNVPYSCEEQTETNNLPKLSYLAFQNLLISNSLSPEWYKYLERELLVKSYYYCNGCSKKLPGHCCKSKKFTFEHQNTHTATATYNFCYNCAHIYK